MSRRYWIETYGCQMNKAESNALEHDFRAAGWVEADASGKADLIVINTCSVRATAEDRIWGRISAYRHAKAQRRTTLVLMGCMAERLKDGIRRRDPAVDMVIGTFQKGWFRSMLAKEEFAGGPVETESYRFASRHDREGDFKSLVPVMHGCDNFCSYCIVPYVRGREVSRSPDEILGEIGSRIREGAREITLLGQNVNSYRYDEATGPLNFPGLLDRVLALAGQGAWVRFLTSHPKDCSADLLDRFAKWPGLCRHLHLPVQHGSNRVLSAMHRGYTVERYEALVREARGKIPDISITTDLLVGFPGETEDDFEATLDLVRRVGYDDAFTYRYNHREGTAAFALEDDVPDEVKLSRLDTLIRVQRQESRRRRQSRLGSIQQVLVEGPSKRRPRDVLARTGHDDMVVFPAASDTVGSFRLVRLNELRGNTFVGEEVAPA